MIPDIVAIINALTFITPDLSEYQAFLYLLLHYHPHHLF